VRFTAPLVYSFASVIFSWKDVAETASISTNKRRQYSSYNKRTSIDFRVHGPSVTNRQTDRYVNKIPTIDTKLCMQIEHVCTIFAPQAIQIRPVVSALRGSEILWQFALSRFLFINPSFIIRKAPNLKHLYRRESCINRINFAEIEQSLQISRFLCFWPSDLQMWTR